MQSSEHFLVFFKVPSCSKTIILKCWKEELKNIRRWYGESAYSHLIQVKPVDEHNMTLYVEQYDKLNYHQRHLQQCIASAIASAMFYFTYT